MARKLHIGGKERQPSWEVLNAQPGAHVDHVDNAKDLSRFPDRTFSEIYASHILEHLDFTGEIQAALLEWHRVLQPGGQLSISVPDMDVLAALFLTKDQLTIAERFHVMTMMFGGHEDKYDYHVIGLNQELLIGFLRDAGFDSFDKVEEFGVFNDTSSMRFRGVLISLNLKARKSLA